MITIKEVKSIREGILFTEFPNKMYKKSEYFVPALSLDERNVFNKKKGYIPYLRRGQHMYGPRPNADPQRSIFWF